MWTVLAAIDATQVLAYLAAGVSVAGAVTGWRKGRTDKDLGDSSEWRQGTRDLLDQVQEERAVLKADVVDCRKECAQVRDELATTRRELHEARRKIDRLERQLQERT